MAGSAVSSCTEYQLSCDAAMSKIGAADLLRRKRQDDSKQFCLLASLNRLGGF